MSTQGHNLLINFLPSYHILSICCNKSIYKYQLFYGERNVLPQVNKHHCFVKICPPEKFLEAVYYSVLVMYGVCKVTKHIIFWNTGKTNYYCWMNHHNLTLCSMHNYLSFYFMYLKHLTWLHKQGRMKLFKTNLPSFLNFTIVRVCQSTFLH